MTDFRIYEMSRRENAVFYGVSGAVALLVACCSTETSCSAQ